MAFSVAFPLYTSLSNVRPLERCTHTTTFSDQRSTRQDTRHDSIRRQVGIFFGCFSVEGEGERVREHKRGKIRGHLVDVIKNYKFIGGEGLFGG